MMRLAPTASALMLCLLTSAATAYAECAWVLWTQIEFVGLTKGKPIDTGDWELETAVPTYAACNDAARERARRRAERKPGETNVESKRLSTLIGGGFSVQTIFKQQENASSYSTFKCFPDTVDSRGPKGGAR